MTYSVKYTNKNNTPISIEDDNLNLSTDISLFGRTKLEYGEDMNALLLHILENFACHEDSSNIGSPDLSKTTTLADTAKKLLSTPVTGQLWYNKTQMALFVWDGTQWSPLSMDGDLSINWGTICNGEQLPKPTSSSGYIYDYSECVWIVSPTGTDSQFDYMLCYTDTEANVIMQYSLDNALRNGIASYMIVGIKGNSNSGSTLPIFPPNVTPPPSSTPQVSVTPTPGTSSVPVTPTPNPSVTPDPTVTPTPGVTVTPTPTITITPTPTITVTPTVTPTISTSPAPPSNLVTFGFGDTYSAVSSYIHDTGASFKLNISSTGTWGITLVALKNNFTNGDPRSGYWHTATPVGSDYEVKFETDLIETCDAEDYPIFSCGTLPASTGWMSLSTSRTLDIHTTHIVGGGAGPPTENFIYGSVVVSIRHIPSGQIISEEINIELQASA